MSDERLRRWRLVLGGGEADGTDEKLSGDDVAMDRVLTSLYDAGRGGGLGRSAPYVARWLGDIRTYFPSSTVHVMQRDALDRFGLTRLLLEPEMLEAVEPDVHLVAALLSLSHAIPDETKDVARQVVARVVRDVERRLRAPTVRAVKGSLDRASRTRNPRNAAEIDWHRTIRRNLHTWQPDRRALVAERLVGYARRRPMLEDVVLCVDQSASMASSVVYAGIFAAVLASLPALRTRMIVFDTEVVDLTDALHDPVELLFGTQLGGGTDISRALGYCQGVVTRPANTVMVLVSDLYEGGDRERMLSRAADLVKRGVNLVCLLALSDDGAPLFDERIAAALANLGVPVFACTPDRFPALIAAALARRDVRAWAAGEGFTAAR